MLITHFALELENIKWVYRLKNVPMPWQGEISYNIYLVEVGGGGRDILCHAQ